MHAFKQNYHSNNIGTGHDDQQDEERSEILSLCSSLDGVIGQLHKQVKALESYLRNLRSLYRTVGLSKAKL